MSIRLIAMILLAFEVAASEPKMIDDYCHSRVVKPLGPTRVTLRFVADAKNYPEPKKTPGAVWQEVTVEMLSEHGYTKRVRDVPQKLKREVMERYKLPVDTMSKYEIDHLVSLELGGSNAIENLWPEPYDGVWNARVKDTLENKMHALIVQGKLDLKTAQREVATDWVAAYRKYVGKEPRKAAQTVE